ncbi:MAG TPA: asparagine synthase (glutamine-hydrolyzing) [Ktedonobacteraceae bacterium]|nr:asparagine synthase (glutamine-hydrolyzing) [Ktedonobacteraceae bacterium]
MCGIVGILKDFNACVPAGTLASMTTEISHRGPDDEGTLFFSNNDTCWETDSREQSGWQVALGSRRLSILDLSPAGHMPMSYQGKFWITYNGEVFNYVEIRAELEKLGHGFRSGSDTEVILAAYAQWGTDCFQRFRGMWGLILFDMTRNAVIISRDRPGIKPLYTWQSRGMVAIASEIKQFLHMPGFVPRMNYAIASEYLRTGYEDQQSSFFQDVCPVPEGCYITISLDTLALSTPQSYWHPERVQIAVTDPREAGRLFAAKLRESVRLRLRSDVPVGCALSGGMDSSAIAMLVNEINASQASTLHTFTSTFPGDPLDERSYVDAVTSSIRSTPHFVTADARTFLEEMDHFLRIHDEPIGSLSIYASYCIARLTRQTGVPVTLNGQGCDEILSGYWQFYFLYLRQLAQQGRLLSLLRHFGGAALKGGNPALLSQIPVMLRRYRARSKPDEFVRLRRKPDTLSHLQKVMALREGDLRVQEIRSFSLPRLLKWDDRNSMAFSVESRYPFLDHELIELCLSFAPATLYHRGWTKWPLRLGLQDTLPHKIFSRRSKFAFEVPQDKWLSGPLRPTLENWLRQDRPLWDLVERADVTRLAEQVWQLQKKRPEPGQALFRLFVFDRWMEIFGMPIGNLSIASKD